jgi:hypothetical protein
MAKDSRFVEFIKVNNKCVRNTTGTYECQDMDGSTGTPFNTYLNESDCYNGGGQWTYSGVGDTHIDYTGYPFNTEITIDINDIAGYDLAYHCNKNVNTSNCMVILNKGSNFETTLSPTDFQTKLAKWFS